MRPDPAEWARGATRPTPSGLERSVFTGQPSLFRSLLGVAGWPGTPLGGMLIYNAAVTLFLAYVGVAGGSTGMLLWPAVVLHAILTALLTRASTSSRKTNT